jgi:hypothetical protein
LDRPRRNASRERQAGTFVTRNLLSASGRSAGLFRRSVHASEDISFDDKPASEESGGQRTEEGSPLS